MPNRELPDSDYDIDKSLAYASIWEQTVDFHHNLKHKAEELSRRDPPLRLHHVDQAFNELFNEIARRVRKRRGSSPGEVRLAFGSGLIGAFVAEALQQLTNGQLPSSLSVIALAMGVFLLFQWRRI